MANYSKYTCLFAHYNFTSSVSRYVINYIDNISSLGIRVIFISNSIIDGKSRDGLNAVNVKNISIRENTGNDFGAWASVINRDLIPEDTEMLLLVNDSVFGPIVPLEPIFREMEGKSDYWGLTDSMQGGWHLQSYFLCFSRNVFNSLVFRKIFRQNFQKREKMDLIKSGEIRLSQELEKSGFKGSAYVSYKNLDQSADLIEQFNPTHFFWDKLILDFRFPFIKRELITGNPENVVNLSEVFVLLKSHTPYDVELIKSCIVETNTLQEANPLDSSERITVLCHIYYPQMAYFFINRLSSLKCFNAKFIFNLSDSLAADLDFLAVLKASFDDPIILHVPEKGRDIGGKLALIDISLKLNISSDHTLIIHDKLSPHTPTGKEWREKLFNIISLKNIPKVINHFRTDPAIGMVGAKEFIKSEYNHDREAFDFTGDMILKNYIDRFNLKLNNYNFIAGTIFFIRTEILESFFNKYDPLQLREELEGGNVLDFNNGTMTHAWERLFSFIVTSSNYKIKGI